jgi:hypothetical protein
MLDNVDILDVLSAYLDNTGEEQLRSLVTGPMSSPSTSRARRVDPSGRRLAAHTRTIAKAA